MSVVGAVRRAVVVAAAGGLLAVGPIGATRAADAATSLGDAGYGFGTSVRLGSTVVSGASAPVYLGCTLAVGITNTNHLATVTVRGVLTVGSVTNTASSIQNLAKTTSTVTGINLLGGMITADAVTATANTAYNAGVFSPNGTTDAVNLVVNGSAQGASIPENTLIPLPGVGSVMLNEQISGASAAGASQEVHAVHVRVTAQGNPLGIPTGTNIWIGFARSSLVRPPGGLLDGQAYGTQMSLNGTVESGKTAYLVMPCTGTNGAVVTNAKSSVSIPGVLTTGAVSSTMQGTDAGGIATGETTNTVHSVDLMGVVTADLVKADAQADNGSGSPLFNDASSFTNLSVAGMPLIGDQVPPNTAVDIPNLGTLYLHRVISFPNSIESKMIELVVTSSAAPLPIGTDITIGEARASLH